MSEEVIPEIGPQQIDAILQYLPIFEKPGYKFGEWHDSGYFSYSPEVDDFIQTLYRQEVVVPFDWTSWQEEARRYQSDPDALEAADLLTLRKLLTTHLRADRFVEGHLASALESGHITAILRRFREIRDGMGPYDRPIPDSYWVWPGQLLAGEYPRDWGDQTSRKKLRRLLEAGVTFFLDLTEAGEYNLKPYVLLLQKEAAALGRAVKHHRMPIRDRGTPTPEEMTHILDMIDSALAAGHTLYVHCYGGIGRTGTVVGCYLVRHGMNGEEALKKIAHLRQGTPDGWVTSPETSTQRQMVRSWSAGK
jgi:protein-tyrosine phosphatase